ncbi:hypothetical protein DSL92_06335 [Billgrantia gudaonensis]|uniref:Polysaccharide biosynthesis protein CapD-like domain-containing protein n=1 Tax=Billgrantia gudaonensis TaxID=376427 RepID=A0A432JIS3_9GAMM|nr:hypothetical protein DSL92_06335 [Halomonas gudaonensis]
MEDCPSLESAAKDDDTIVSCVRYGSVMCSRGSVIPLFIKQIREGKPLTITEPSRRGSCSRYRMLSSWSTNARQGDIFVKGTGLYGQTVS